MHLQRGRLFLIQSAVQTKKNGANGEFPASFTWKKRTAIGLLIDNGSVVVVSDAWVLPVCHSTDGRSHLSTETGGTSQPNLFVFMRGIGGSNALSKRRAWWTMCAA
jgi:hypothetical protein